MSDRQYYVDNQPSYYSTLAMRNLKGVLVDVVMREHFSDIDPEDMCEPTVTKMLVKVLRLDGLQDRKEMVRTLIKGFSPPSCSCEHDCCGHRHGYASVELLTPDTAVINIHTSRNY